MSEGIRELPRQQGLGSQDYEGKVSIEGHIFLSGIRWFASSCQGSSGNTKVEELNKYFTLQLGDAEKGQPP